MVGGLIPSPLHLISTVQVSLHRWRRALLILIGPPLLIDTALLILTLFFYSYVPHNVARVAAIAGGTLLLVMSGISLNALRRNRGNPHERSANPSPVSVIAASLAELSAPGTWIYWMTLAGPILAEGRRIGYLRVAPFFAGGLFGYYGAAVFCVWLLAWGAKLHRSFTRRLTLAADLLLLVLGIGYLANAFFGL